ncbi:hypothetical protein COXBURSA331_A0017 [Coxiella burnetii RSA 331]|nr:hypothetical protein COXBURSA331_A0017 [Coxiella burnetii RSA 331]
MTPKWLLPMFILYAGLLGFASSAQPTAYPSKKFLYIILV